VAREKSNLQAMGMRQTKLAGMIWDYYVSSFLVSMNFVLAKEFDKFQNINKTLQHTTLNQFANIEWSDEVLFSSQCTTKTMNFLL
jgi:hypothetical protein